MSPIIKKTLHTLTGLLLAVVFVAPAQAEEVTYYHLDVLGSTVAATDDTGAVLWTESYEPFGERRERSDGGSNSQWYTGKTEDTAIGLNYFGARWYNSRTGRFTAMDPVGFVESNPQSFNRYAYANNNPYKFVDPDGRVPILIPLVAAIAKELGGAAIEHFTGIPATSKTIGKKIFKEVVEKGVTKETTKKLSKVKKEVREETIGGGKFTKKTKVFPGKGPGQSRSEMEFVKNSDGKLIRSRKFSFDRGNKFQHKKPARGGPEGRPANEN